LLAHLALVPPLGRLLLSEGAVERALPLIYERGEVRMATAGVVRVTPGTRGLDGVSCGVGCAEAS
jgi:hypothetical protein